jgi:hypothetical protein
MDSEANYSEADKKIALALGVTLEALAEQTSKELSSLYVKLRVGGGIFSGKQMTPYLATATRYEILSYLSALIAILVENWPHKTSPPEPIMVLLEKSVFSFTNEKIKLNYLHYLERYYHPRQSDSASLPRESIVHSEFVQRLAEIWCLFQRTTESNSAVYASALVQLSQSIESALTGALTGIWPETT